MTSAFAFATDLADEGVEAVLGNIQERGGLDGITPAFVYHAARDVFPHNPKRKVYLLDRGEFFFRPDPTRYAGLRIQPRVSPVAREADVLSETCTAAERRGLHVNAWTVFLHADRPDEYPDCATENAFGDRYPADWCPANPDVRAYVRALVSDVARNGVATILAESLHYHGLEHGYHHERYFIELGAATRFLLGLCFCEHCLAAAGRAGVDGAAVRAAVRAELESAFVGDAAAGNDDELAPETLPPLAGADLAGYLDARAQTVTSLTADAVQTAADGETRLVFLDPSGAAKGYASGRPAGAPAAEIGWRFGIDFAQLRNVCPEIEALGYAHSVERLRLELESYRRSLGTARVAVALRPSPPDCDAPENLRAKVRLAHDLGATRLDFYHYGFFRLEALDWIRSALET